MNTNHIVTRFALATVLFSAPLLFNSCKKDPFPVNGKGGIVTEFRSVGHNFTALHSGIDADVYFKQGPYEQVELRAQRNILDIIELNTTGGTLHIQFRKGTSAYSYAKPQIFITAPEFTEIKVSGSGDMYSQNVITGDEILLQVSGSGELYANLDMNKVSTRISGSGDVELDGKTTTHNVEVSGSGEIEAFGLESDNCIIRVSGSGDAEVFVNYFLDVKISGSGSVRYRGNPQVNSQISGSGSVKKVN